MESVKKHFILLGHLDEMPELAAAAHYHPHSLATLLNMTLRSLERECCDCFAMSPAKLLSEMWLIEVKRQLQDKLAKQVFDNTGFERLPDFCRKFRTVAGITVTQWKESPVKESTDAVAKLFTLLSRNANSKKLLPHFIGVKRHAVSKNFNLQASHRELESGAFLVEGEMRAGGTSSASPAEHGTAASAASWNSASKREAR